MPKSLEETEEFDLCPSSEELKSPYFDSKLKIYYCKDLTLCYNPEKYRNCPKYNANMWDVR